MDIQVDDARYDDGTRPSHELSNIWMEAKIPEEHRIRVARFANTVPMMRFLAQTQIELMMKLAVLIGDLWPKQIEEGRHNPDTIRAEMQWTAVWDSAWAIHNVDKAIAAEVRKDPDKMVEMPDTARGMMWQSFNRSRKGREILLTPWTRPHRYFIEIFRRDVNLHHIPQMYVLSRIYLECDQIEVERKLGPTLEDALKWKSTLEIITVRENDLEGIDHRIQAFWITCDLTGVIRYDWESGPSS